MCHRRQHLLRGSMTKAVSINGHKLTMSTMRLSLIKRVLPEKELRRHIERRTSYTHIAKEFEVTPSDVTQLVKYYELVLPAKPVRSAGKVVDVDLLADRIWTKNELRLTDLIGESGEQLIRSSDFKNLVNAQIEEYFKSSLKEE